MAADKTARGFVGNAAERVRDEVAAAYAQVQDGRPLPPNKANPGFPFGPYEDDPVEG